MNKDKIVINSKRQSSNMLNSLIPNNPMEASNLHQKSILARNKEGQVTLAIDIDGTIFEYDTYTKNQWGEPIEGAIDTINELKNKYNCYIILHTARGNDERKALENYLANNKLQYNELVMNKPIADMYIDDRAVKFIANDKVCINKKADSKPKFNIGDSVKWESEGEQDYYGTIEQVNSDKTYKIKTGDEYRKIEEDKLSPMTPFNDVLKDRVKIIDKKAYHDNKHLYKFCGWNEVKEEVLKLDKMKDSNKSISTTEKAIDRLMPLPSLWYEDKEGNRLYVDCDDMDTMNEIMENGGLQRCRMPLLVDSCCTDEGQLYRGESSFNCVEPIVLYLIGKGWKLTDAITVAACTCERCVNILLEETTGEIYEGRDTANTHCELCNIIDPEYDKWYNTKQEEVDKRNKENPVFVNEGLI